MKYKYYGLINRIFIGLLFTIFIILSGCTMATVNYMAFEKTTETIDVGNKSILLMTLDFSRSDKNNIYDPNMLVVHFQKPNAKNREDRQNFSVGWQDKISISSGESIYFIRMALDPGKYQLNSITAISQGIVLNGKYVIPLFMDINVQKNVTTYIGRITVMHRPRQENEFPAGPKTPLIDQAMMNIYTGTLDINISDMSKDDLQNYKSTYPALKYTEIITAILPEFDRSKIKNLWGWKLEQINSVHISIPHTFDLLTNRFISNISIN